MAVENVGRGGLLEALRCLPAAATPLSWASEDSVLVHSAINTVENCRLKDLRLSTIQRVKSAPASLHKMIKRIAEATRIPSLFLSQTPDSRHPRLHHRGSSHALRRRWGTSTFQDRGKAPGSLA